MEVKKIRNQMVGRLWRADRNPEQANFFFWSAH